MSDNGDCISETQSGMITSKTYDHLEGFSTKPVDMNDSMVVEEILGLFDKNSREYKYVEIWMDFSGALPGVKYEVPDSALECAAAKLLGFANASSSGYKNVRWNVRRVINEYLESVKII